MAELIKINKKCINDPLYTPVEAFLKARIARLEIEGPADELALAKERYTGLVAGDLVIENPVMFPDGITRVCFCARKTGFARVDVDIQRVTMKDILDDFSVPIIEITDPDNLKAYVKTNPTESALLWCVWLKNYGVLLNQNLARSISGPMAAFSELFFSTYTTERESLTSIDYDTLESGTVTITDASFGTGVYPLFIYELILDEANVPEITSNLPVSITTQRGKDFVIPNTYWFNTVEDITHTATVELTTKLGYTIPTRSADGNEIDGETIFGSSTTNITDEIIVRVTHMWNGRPVKKTFRINVNIEKDTSYDLTFTVNPDTVTTASGGEVQVGITAFFNGTKVTIAVPPSALISQNNWGNLRYQSTTADGEMIYLGVVSANIPNEFDKLQGLYVGTFSYQENSNVHTAPAYVNMIVVRPESLPKFEIRGLTNIIRGRLNDTGTIEVKAFYGDDPIPATDLDIKTGVKGIKGLLRYDSVLENGVTYTIVKDSNKPGETVLDSFEQVFRWIGPNGVRNTIARNITVMVTKASKVEVVPYYDQPLIVNKYQTGRTPFTLKVNDVDVTFAVSNYAFTDPSNMITPQPGAPFGWIVTSAPTDKATETTVTFKFRYTVDGIWRNFEYEQKYLVNVWTQDPDTDEPGINTKTVATPSVLNISGLTEEKGTFDFQVYYESTDITATAVYLSGRTVVPTNITIDSVAYVPETKTIRISYTKVTEGAFKGKIYFGRPGIDPLKPEDIALVNISTNIQQSRKLVVKSFPELTGLEIDKEGEANIYLSFAGTRVPLNDANLTRKQLNSSDTVVTKTGAETLTLIDTIWRQIGGTRREIPSYEFTYVDPLDRTNVSKVIVNLVVVVTFPPMRLVVDSTDPIAAKIWDKGTLPMRLMAGDKDWTSSVTKVVPTTPNKYISFTGLKWDVIWAEKTETTTIIPIEISWTVGEIRDQKFQSTVTFVLAPWDQITFGGTWTPTDITGPSGTAGDIVANFVYKGNVATKDVILVKEQSDVPVTFKITEGTQVEGKGLVTSYTTSKGGDGILKLLYKHVPTGLTIVAPITTSIAWPEELNLVNIGTKVEGFYQDTVPFDLEFNFSGTPVSLTNPNMVITTTSGADEPITLKEKKAKTLDFLLVKGGNQGTNYDYSISIHVSYTDPQGVVWVKDYTIPATIKIPAVRIGRNQKVNTFVWRRGEIDVTMVDALGKEITITSYAARGTNPYVSFITPKSWYVVAGSEATAVDTTLPITVSYTYAGVDYNTDIDIPFGIARYDGKKLTVVADKTELKGVAGQTGVVKFTFTYMGDPLTGVTLDQAKSGIPLNLLIGNLQEDGSLTYTFANQAVDKATFYFLRPNAPATPVVNQDYVTLDMTVTTTASDLDFVLVNSGAAVSINFRETTVIPLSFMYGNYAVKPNAPGMTYSLADTASKSIQIVGATDTGITVRATKSNVSGSVTLYPEDFIVTYSVGSPTPKVATWTTDVTISMGVAQINNNEVVNGKVWDRGVFAQNVKFGTGIITVIDHYEMLDANNQWVELTAPRSWEIIGGEPIVSTKVIPMRLYYKVDAVATLQTLDFNASFVIAAYTGQRFYVVMNPANIETSIGNDQVINCRPVYKDVSVGALAKFKPELSTIPKELEIKSVTTSGTNYLITFTGKAAGLSSTKLVFWSPDAGTTPKPRDTWEGTLPTKVIGELGIEIGDRDNLLVGKHDQTGTYKLNVLFGGIPLNVSEEVTAGRLKFAVEAVNDVNGQAGTITITGYTATGFTYKLTGPVAPGQTVDVSDFLNLTYTYGGTNFSRRVEVPQRFTSGAITIVAIKAYTVNRFSENINVGVTSITSDGKDILARGTTENTGWLRCIEKETDAPGYVSFKDKTFSITNADTTAKVVTDLVSYVGRYRLWTWSVDNQVVFNISAWDQVTFNVSFVQGSDKISTQINTAFNLFTTTVYKGQTSFIGVDLIDYNLTKFDGLMDVTSTVADVTRTRYICSALKAGTKGIVFTFRRPNSPVPGVEGIDWCTATLALDVFDAPLTITGFSTLTMANGDKRAAPVKVALGGTNIPINSPLLRIKPDTADVFTLDGANGTPTATQYNVICTLPLNEPAGVFKDVVVKMEYDDPVSGNTRYGSYTQQIFVKAQPDDYPVVSVYRTIVTSLWARGGSVNTVTASGVDITAQCSLDAWGASNTGVGWATDVGFAPNPGNDWYQIVGRSASAGIQYQLQNYTIKAPYRGGTVILPAQVFWGVGGGPEPVWFTGTLTPTPFELTKDKPGELLFKMLYRNVPWTAVTLNQAESGFGTSLIINDIVNDGGDLHVRYTGGDPYLATVKFTWDLDGSTTPVVGRTRTSLSSNTYAGPVFTSTSPTIPIWGSALLNTFISAKVNGVEYINQTTLVSVSDPWLTLITASSGTGPAVQRTNGVTDQVTKNVVFRLRMPAVAGGLEYDVTVAVIYPAWNGDFFQVIENGPNTTFKEFAVGTESLVSIFGFFKGGSTQTTMNLDATKLLTFNDGSLRYVSSSTGGGNRNERMFGVKARAKGDVQLPFNYTGVGSTEWPVGTLGKNYFILTVKDVQIYTPGLFFYPDDIPPTEATLTALNATTLIPTMLQNGLGRNQLITPNGAAKPTVAANGIIDTALRVSVTHLSVQCIYNNRGADFEVTLPITWTASGIGTRVYDQKFLVKGTNVGDQVVVSNLREITGAVWSRGTLPFTISINGVGVTDPNYKSIAVATNKYVSVGNGTRADGYQIVGGELTATKFIAKYTVVVSDGGKTFTVNQDVVFNISPYDGNDVVVVPYQPNAFNGGWVGNPGVAAICYLQVFYRGINLGVNAAVDPTGTINGTMATFSSLGPNATFSSIFMTGGVEGPVSGFTRLKLGPAGRVNAPDAVENKDFVYYQLPTYCYITNKYYAISGDSTVEGKYGAGNTYNWRYAVRYGITTVTFATGGTTGPNSFQVVPTDAIAQDTAPTATVIPLKFATEIGVPVKTTNATFRIGRGADLSLYATYPVTVIQNSSVIPPTITEVKDVAAKINESGPLPFKVMNKGVDITNQITTVTISDNNYVDIVNKQWHIKSAAASITSLMPTITVTVVVDGVTFSLPQTVKFTIAAWNGKTITAKADPFLTKVGEKAIITVTGDYSGASLFGNVTFDKAKSDPAGLVTFGNMTAATGGNLAIEVTGLAVGVGNVKIHLVSVNDTGSGNPNSDYADVTVAGEVLPVNLTPVAGFVTEGTGGYSQPTTLAQSTLSVDKPIANTDPNLIIGISDTTKAFIKSITATTITYGYVNDIVGTTDTIKFNLTFTYKGRSNYIVPVTLNQIETPVVPYVSGIQEMTVEWDKSFATPFKVLVDR